MSGVGNSARRRRQVAARARALLWVTLASLWITACAAQPPALTRAPDHDPDGPLRALTDRCPALPEDLDGFEDDDGCPDRDNDGDGVLDAHTWDGQSWTNCDGRRIGQDGEDVHDCRDLPEDFDGFEDDDGCPDVLMLGCASHHVRLRYDPASLSLSPEAPVILDALAEFIAGRPDLHFFIDGHAAPQRRREGAEALGRRAAEQLQAELSRRGAPTLEIRSFGDRQPMAPNDTPEGRMMNTHVDVSWEECGSGGVPLCGEARPRWRHPLEPDAGWVRSTRPASPRGE